MNEQTQTIVETTAASGESITMADKAKGFAVDFAVPVLKAAALIGIGALGATYMHKARAKKMAQAESAAATV